MSFMKAGIIAPEKMEQNIYTTISARNCVRLPVRLIKASAAHETREDTRNMVRLPKRTASLSAKE